MDYACYGRPGGPKVTPQEFIRRASPRYKERGIFPYCEACNARVDLYGVHTLEGPTRFDHADLPNDADPLDDCILANRNPRFKGMHPRSFNSEHGKRLREEFFDSDNIRRVYCFMWKLCGPKNFPIKSFIKSLERADKKKIWSYSGIPLWTIPFILLTLDNFIHHKGFGFHFYIKKKKSTSIDDIWSENGKNSLCKVLTSSGELLEKTTIQNPLQISEDVFLELSSENSWIDQQYVNLILRNR